MAYNYLFKFVLIGDTNTGKTNISSMFTENRFISEHRTTIGIEF